MRDEVDTVSAKLGALESANVVSANVVVSARPMIRIPSPNAVSICEG